MFENKDKRKYGQCLGEWFEGLSYTTTFSKDMLESNPEMVAELEFKIRELRPLYDECISIHLSKEGENLSIGEVAYFKLTRDRGYNTTHLYTIKIEVVDKDNGKIIYNIRVDIEKALQIFKEICVYREKPHFEDWILRYRVPSPEPKFSREILEWSEEGKQYENIGHLFGNRDLQDYDLDDFLYGEVLKGKAFHALDESAISMAIDFMLYHKDYKTIKYFFNELSLDFMAKVVFAMGEIYFFGYLGKQDYKQAYKYYKHAAKIGSIKAYYRLAIIYKYGLGVRKNNAKYVDMLNKLIEIVEEFDNTTLFTVVEVYSELAKVFLQADNIDSVLQYCKRGLQRTQIKMLLHCGDVNLPAVTELIDLQYTIKEFDVQKADLIDLFYIAQKPCTITLFVDNKKIIVEIKRWKSYLYILCEGKIYENIAIFLSDYKVNNRRLIEYANYLRQLRDKYIPKAKIIKVQYKKRKSVDLN